MKIDDEEIRRLYGGSVHENHLELRKQCPTLNKVYEFFGPGLSRNKKLRIIDHITSCTSCSAEFVFLLEVHRRQESLIHNINKEIPTSFPRLFFLRFASVAAGLFLFVFVSLFLYRHFAPSHSRGAIEDQIRLQQPGGRTSSASPILFKWNADLDAEYYILEIFDTSLRLFLRVSDIESDSYLLTRDIISRMKLDEPYYWIVTAVDSEGHKSESKIRELILYQ